MSVIMRNISGGGSRSSSKGFPPGDVNIISINSGVKSCRIRFSDPDNSIYNNSTLATWKSTIIVRKEGSAPTSIKDGVIVLENTTKNKYKDNYFTDNNVSVNKTYYYRFYTMSTDKVYNDSTSMIRSCLIREFNPILKNNTWEEIIEAAASGVASTLWKVGDEIDITLSGTFNETVTLQIWDFNHFDKSDGSGKANICFGMKHLMKNYQPMNSDYTTNEGGWNDTDMKKTVMNNIFKSMPSNLQYYIKEVNTYANQGGYSSSSSIGKLSKDKVFLPGLTEINDNWSSQNQTESNQKKFPIFTDNNSRIKKLSNGSGSANTWCTRSPSYYSHGDFCFVGSDGNSNSYAGGASAAVGVCFCFNI